MRSSSNARSTFIKLVELLSKSPYSFWLCLQDPCPSSKIALVEKEVGLEFPQDLIDALKVANGQDQLRSDPVFPRLALGGRISTSSSGWLLGVDDIVSNTKLHQSYCEGMSAFETVGPTKYHAKLLNISFTANSDAFFLDLAPQPGGCYGQVVWVCEQPNYMAVIADSSDDLLDGILEGFVESRFQRIECDEYQNWKESEWN